MTVAYLPPKVYHNGTMTFEHDFKQAGHYVGIVTVTDDLGNAWVSRFPFTVGLYTFMGMIEYIFYAIGFTALCGFLWYMLRQRAQKTPAAAAAASSKPKLEAVQEIKTPGGWREPIVGGGIERLSSLLCSAGADKTCL